MFETMTWTVLGIHDKPSGVLDVGGYWQPLFGMLEKMQSEGFVRRPWRELLSVAENVDALLDQLASSASQSAN
ncbi:MAG: putative Rossmann-fold nucleotide-binding protein [Gammaproteobacteria bacterium]